MASNEVVTFARECDAITVPVGDHVRIPQGTIGRITQALGSSFTIYIAGNLVRVAGENADAIGKQPPERLTLPDGATDEDVERMIVAQLYKVYDPEIPVNLMDLGLIYECSVDHGNGRERTVSVLMTLTAPGCGMGDIMLDDVRTHLLEVPTITHVEAEIVLEPPWEMEMMSDAARLQVGMM